MPDDVRRIEHSLDSEEGCGESEAGASADRRAGDGRACDLRKEGSRFPGGGTAFRRRHARDLGGVLLPFLYLQALAVSLGCKAIPLDLDDALKAVRRAQRNGYAVMAADIASIAQRVDREFVKGNVAPEEFGRLGANAECLFGARASCRASGSGRSTRSSRRCRTRRRRSEGSPDRARSSRTSSPGSWSSSPIRIRAVSNSSAASFRCCSSGSGTAGLRRRS